MIVLFNTADHSILVDDLDVAVGANRTLQPLLGERAPRKLVTDAHGRLDAILQPRAIIVLKPGGQTKTESPVGTVVLEIEPMPADFVAVKDFEIGGTVSMGGIPLQLLLNGNADEGDYLEIKLEPSDWSFGGAEADAPKIMDDALIRLAGTALEE